MLLKLLKLKANEAISSGATDDQQQRQRDLAKDLPRPAAVDPRSLLQLDRDGLERAERDQEEIRGGLARR